MSLKVNNCVEKKPEIHSVVITKDNLKDVIEWSKLGELNTNSLGQIVIHSNNSFSIISPEDFESKYTVKGESYI